MTRTKKTEEIEANDADGSKEKKVKKIETPSSAGDNIEDKKEKLAKLKEKLKEKAKELSAKIDEKKIDIKKEVKIFGSEKEDSIVPMEDYFKSSIHLGTRVITPDMKKFVYKRRADGLAVLNMALVDDKIKEAAEYIAGFEPDKIIVVCKREAGWKAVELFAKTFGIQAFTKKYPAGILTNTTLDNFREADLLLICDPWLDRNALMDANRIKIPVLTICDTNNYTAGTTVILPGNNKSAKSLGMIFYILSKIYAEKRKLDVELPKIQNFIEDWDNLVPPK